MFPNVWQEFRVVGVEDGGFFRVPLRRGVQKALLICVLFRGTGIDGLRVDKITVDGLDASDKLIGLLHGLSFDAVMLAGVSFAGFNLIDPTSVFETFHKPIVVISRTRPNNLAVKNALCQHFNDWQVRWSVFEKLGPIHEVISMPQEPPIYVEVIGADLSWANALIRASTAFCRIPEPIRVARLIAQGLTRNIRWQKNYTANFF